MHVPRITQEFFPLVSGPANQALALSAGLERLGIRSPVLTTTPAPDERPADAGVTVRRFRPLLALTNFRVAPGLLHALLRAPADVLHIHGWRNPASESALLAARRRRLPVVVQAHGVAFGYRHTREAAWLRLARGAYELASRRLVLAGADAVVAMTGLEARELRAYGFPPERIAIIPCGVAPAFHAAGAGVRPAGAGLSLLTVGRLSTRRNLEQIIAALALLRGTGVAARLRIVGPEVRLTAGDSAPYRRQLEALAQRLGVWPFITFVGPRQGAALVEEYRAADVFVATTLYENFGQPVAEAAAAGLPIVATPTGVAQDLLADGTAGIAVPFHDAPATAAALGQLCGDPALRRRMGRAAHAAAAAFTWERIVPRYAELYAALLARRGQAGARV